MGRKNTEKTEQNENLGFSEEEIEKAKAIHRKVERQANIFIKDVKSFLKEKNGGTIPSEWALSIQLLDTYYRQFLQCSLEIAELPSLIIHGRYGDVPNPLLAILNTSAVRLEKMMSELGLSLKAAAKLELSKPVAEESPLDAFVKKTNNAIEKRSR